MIYADVGRKKDDPWWQFVNGAEQFNMNRRYCVASSIWKVFDESMSAFRPQTSPTGTYLTSVMLKGNRSLWAPNSRLVVVPQDWNHVKSGNSAWEIGPSSMPP